MRAGRREISHGTRWCARWLIAAAATVSLSTACSDSLPPIEPGSSPPPPPPTDPPARWEPFPQPARAGRIYRGDDSLYALFDFSHQGRLVSRYVLYDDATFALQFFSPRFGFFEYAGEYAQADSLIDFEFEGWSTAGPWEATGTLRGDSLIVEYNDAMSWSDFMNGAYVRSPGSP